MTRAAPLLAVLALAGLGRPATPPAAAQPDSLPAERAPFTPGEHLEYEVKFGIFRVGEASMQVLGIDTLRGVPVYHVVFAIHGRAIFYTMEDSLESWFSVDGIVSRRFVQNNVENGNRYFHTYEIHPEQGYFVQDGKDSLPTTARPLDDASFFYFARTLPLTVGQTYTFDRYFKPDRNPVTLTVLGMDSVTTPAGRFAAVAIRPVFKSRGLFAEGGRAVVYLAADSTRIPLAIKSHMAVGSLSLLLKSRN